jgi:hypothetical protein
MRDWKRAASILVAAAAVAGIGLVLPPAVAAHGRGGAHGHVVVGVGGFYGYGPYWGFGYGYWPWGGPYWWGYPGYYYGAPGGVDMNYAMMAGFGAIEMNVKPNRAEVWVDGKYVGEARDLDGYPSYLWLEKGAHRIEVYKGGFASFDEQVDVQRGMRKELKIRLQPGSSQAPGPRPGDKPAENPKDKPKEETSLNPFE